MAFESCGCTSVIGEPVNLAAYLCSEAAAGTVLVDVESFGRAGGLPAEGRVMKLRSKKRHQRIEALCARYTDASRRRGLLPAALSRPTSSPTSR